jgi:Glycosyltransferase
MKRGIYLVTEPGCMDPKGGAYQHISVGYRELSRHFDMKMIAPPLPSNLAKKADQPAISKKKQSNSLMGALRDIRTFIQNHKNIFRLYKSIKRLSPDFIYERSAFLNFQGLMIARLLSIPHFYENNGIAAHFQHSYYYRSILHKLTLWVERKAYEASSFVFYVGTWGFYFNSPKRNWMNVENGIEESLLKSFKDFRRQPGEKVVVGFIGRLMKHHDPHLLIEAFKLLRSKEKCKLLLIGPNLNEIADGLQGIVECENIGYISRDDMPAWLRQIDIGIIPGAEEYLSQMKLFDYAAARAMVICPDTINLTHWFSKDEVVFFKKGSAKALADALEAGVANPSELIVKGNKIYNKVSGNFTWISVFNQKASIISSKIASNS